MLAGLVIDTFSLDLSPQFSEVFRLIVGIVIAAIAARGAVHLSEALRNTGSYRSAAWRLMGLAAIVSFCGWGLYGAAKYGFGLEMKAGWVDWFDIASALLAASSLGIMAFSWPVAGRLRVMLDSTISTSSIAVFSWYFVIANLWHVTQGGVSAKLTVIAEPVTDTVLIFLGIVVMICAAGVRRLSLPVGFMTSGSIALGLGALSVHLAKTFQVFDTAQPGRYLMPLGWLLIGAGARFWSVKGEAEKDLKDELRTRIRRDSAFSSVGPYAIALIAFSLVAFQELRRMGAVSGGVFLLSSILMTLVVVRQLLTLHENQALAQRVSEFNEDLERKVELRTSQINSLHTFSKAIGNSIDLESVINAAREHAGIAFEADAVVLNVTQFAFSTSANTKPMVRQYGLEGREWVLEELNILEAPGVASFGTLHDQGFEQHLKYMIAPIPYKGKTYGWLAVFRENRSFDHSDAKVIEGLGMEIGTALENARLYEMARQMADIDSVTGLLNHRAAQERFEFAFQHAKDQSESLSILILDVNNFKFFNDTYGHLVGDQVLKGIAKTLKECLGAHDVPARYGGDEFLAILPNATVAQAEELALKVQAAVAANGYVDPGASDRVIPYGVSVGYGTYPQEATSRHELISLADKSMYKQKRAEHSGVPAPARRSVRREASPEGFDLLDSMITAIDNKDYYTRAHSEEVTEYALWIAQELGLSEEAQRTIRLAGLLHDVGKIGIPDEILRKPGHLTDEEFDVMKQHPEVGAFMVGNIPGLSDIVPGVRNHHERWDGAGYPDGLAGEAIPYLARILAVPDVFSALTTDRPYRKGMEWDKALQVIQEGRGSHFEPRIVDAFARAIEKRRSEPKLMAA